jgi:hypothetical protein
MQVTKQAAEVLGFYTEAVKVLCTATLEQYAADRLELAGGWLVFFSQGKQVRLKTGMELQQVLVFESGILDVKK